MNSYSFYLTLFLISCATSKRPEKVNCVNDLCDIPISKGVGLLKYNSADPDILSLQPNEEVLILSKSAGAEKDVLWGVQINKRRGFLPAKFIRETKLLTKPTVLVEVKSLLQPVTTSPKGDEVNPDSVQRPHVNIEGTIIYTDEGTTETDLFLNEDQDNQKNTNNKQKQSDPKASTEHGKLSSKPTEATTELFKVEENDANKNSKNELNPTTTELPDVSPPISQDVAEDSTTLTTPLPTTVSNLVTNPVSIMDRTDTVPEALVTANTPVTEKHSTSELPIVTSDAENFLNSKEKETDTLQLANLLTTSNTIGNDKEQTRLVNSNPDKKSEIIKEISQNVSPSDTSVLTQIIEPIDSLVQTKLPDVSTPVPLDIAKDPNVSATALPDDITNSTPVLNDIGLNKILETTDVKIESPDESTPTLLDIPEDPTSLPTTSSHSTPILDVTEKIILEQVSDASEMVNSISHTKGQGNFDNSEATLEVEETTIEPPNQLSDLNESGSNQTPHPTLSENITYKEAAQISNLNENTFGADNKLNSAGDVADSNFPSISTTGEVENISLNNLNQIHSKIDSLLQIESEGNNEVEENIDPIKNDLQIQIDLIQEKMTTEQDKSEAHVDTSSISPAEVETSFDEPIQNGINNLFNQFKDQPHSQFQSEHDGQSKTNLIKTEPEYIIEQPSKQEQTTTGKDLASTKDSFNTAEENIEMVTVPNPSDIPAIEDNQSDSGIFSGILTTISDMWTPTEKQEIYEEDHSDIKPLPNQETNGNSPEKEIESPVPKTEQNSFAFISYFSDLYNNIFFNGVDIKDLYLSTGEMCFEHEFCDATAPRSHTGRLILFLGVTGITMLLFTLGYYYIDVQRHDGRLVGMVNSLQRDLLCTTKECELLKEQLYITKEKLAGIEDNSFGSNEMVQSLKQEIEELKLKNNKLRDSLDDNEKLLIVSEKAALEMQKSLGDLENTLSEIMAERNSQEEQITDLSEKVQEFEKELTTISSERDALKLRNLTIEKELESKNTALAELQANMDEVSSISHLRECELKALKEIMKKMDETKDLTELIDATKLKAKVMQATQERDKIKTEYETERFTRISLANDLESTRIELSKYEEQYKVTETRLEVLGKYFQEREAELLKELSTKESEWLSKQGESMTTVEKIEALQKEVLQYKEMCESARRELAESNAARRAAEAECERRAHESWLEAQRAKREAQAHKDEAATLRRQLNATQQLPSPVDGILPRVLDVLPPPLPPPLPRPPPLGRLPSPLTTRYSDSRFSPDSRAYSPERRPYPERRDYSPPLRDYIPNRRAYSPDSRHYSPDRSRRSPYSPESRRSRNRYYSGGGRTAGETETDYSPPRRRYSRHSGPSSGSGASSDSNV